MTTATFDQFSTAHYEFANGRKPRGFGTWMFRMDWSDDYAATMSYGGTYSEAKAKAMRHARTSRKAPACRVSVCS